VGWSECCKAGLQRYGHKKAADCLTVGGLWQMLWSVRGFERCSGGLDFSRVFSRGMRLFPPLFPPSLIHGGDRGR